MEAPQQDAKLCEGFPVKVPGNPPAIGSCSSCGIPLKVMQGGSHYPRQFPLRDPSITPVLQFPLSFGT
jgi:hypothetical protein